MKLDSFDIDNGELDGLSPAAAFVMGVEWMMFREKLSAGEPFRDAVNGLNVERCVALCDRYGRFNESRPVPEMPGWHVIVVGGHK